MPNKSFTNKNLVHTLHFPNESEKNENKLKTLVLPIVLAFVACVTPVLFLLHDWSNGVKLTVSKPTECKELTDSLKSKEAQLVELKKNAYRNEYDKYRTDSVLLEQDIYDISKAIRESKCD